MCIKVVNTGHVDREHPVSPAHSPHGRGTTQREMAWSLGRVRLGCMGGSRARSRNRTLAMHGLEERAMQRSLEGEAKKVKEKPGRDQNSKMHHYRIIVDYYLTVMKLHTQVRVSTIPEGSFNCMSVTYSRAVIRNT